MKKIISILLVCVILFSFVGCNDKGRTLYNLNLKKYVEFEEEYKNIPVDQSSETFAEYREDIMEEHIEKNQFYVHKTEGKVAKGDVVNIDYVGKIDGVAFDGGTAKAQNLEIGSKTYIDGFEDGLIGVEIGKTVDLNLTFPDDYTEELAGKAVVFTVTVNYVLTDQEEKPEVYAQRLGFKKTEEYYEYVDIEATRNYLSDVIGSISEVKKYPKTDEKILLEQMMKTLSQNVEMNYGIKMEEYLEYIGQSEEQYKENLIEESIHPMMESQMAMYYILDAEELGLAQEEIDAVIDTYVSAGNDITADDVIDYYGEAYLESITVTDKVIDYLYKSAKITK